MDRRMLMDTIVLSLKIASIATGLSLLAGVVLAQVFAGKRQRGVILVEVCISVPMFLPPAVTGYFLLLLLGSHGPIGGVLERWLGVEIVFTQAAAVIAAVMVTVPIVFKSMKGHFESIEEDVLHAARMDGAEEVLVFLLVKLPMAMRGLSSSVMIAFLRAMGEFGITLMIAGNIPGRTQTLSLGIYQEVMMGDAEFAGLYALILFVLATGITAVVHVMEDRIAEPSGRRGR